MAQKSTQKVKDFEDEYSDFIKTARKNGVESDDIKLAITTVKAMREREKKNNDTPKKLM